MDTKVKVNPLIKTAIGLVSKFLGSTKSAKVNDALTSVESVNSADLALVLVLLQTKGGKAGIAVASVIDFLVN